MLYKVLRQKNKNGLLFDYIFRNAKKKIVITNETIKLFDKFEFLCYIRF